MRIQMTCKVAAVSDHADQFNEVTFEPSPPAPFQPFKGQFTIVVTDDDVLHKFGPGQIIELTFSSPD